ncbi:ImmA/IrrE family metallo-endopeptidase [Dactylosporangium sp. NPDC049525]|uniref:ImmA/IrrE family metallo-endopeptidase n=1 Tax=Dactylosporangium sp. NPDC049525 TaxID=3154730 RepID=UPI0034426DBA
MTTGTSGSRSKLVDELVPLMLAHLAGIGVDLRELADNPAAVIPTVDDIVLTWVEPAAIGSDCSVAALYNGRDNPPRITVARDASPGRCAFSALHEFGHHLCTRVTAITDAFWDLPDSGASIEEDLVDAFAAAILLPLDMVTTTFVNGVNAASVVDLWQATSASREACCVAAAQRLSAPGYVMLLDTNGRCQFAARHGDLFSIARGSVQTGVKLQQALRGGTARGVERPDFLSGVRSSEMHFEAVAAGSYIFAVWVTDSPAWDALPVPLDSGPVGHSGYCEACDKEFTAWKPPCDHCGEPQCPTCGRCDCEPASDRKVTTRRCTRCYLDLPLWAFEGSSTTCNEH